MVDSQLDLAGRPTHARLTAEQVLHVLGYIADTCGVELEHAAADAAVRRVMAEERVTPDDWFEILGRVAKAVGLSVHAVRRTVGMAAAEAHPTLPWIAGDRAGGCFAVLQRRGNRVLVRDLMDDGERWVSVSQLLGRLGLDAHEQGLWVIAEPAFPMAALRDHGDGSAFARLRGLLRLERGDIGVVAAYAMAIGILSLVVPLTVQSLVNTVAFGVLLQPLVVLTVIVMLALGAAAGLRVIQTNVVELVQRRLFVRAAIDLAYRLPKVAPGGFGAYHGPEMVNRFFDVLTLQKSASSLLLDGIGVVLTTVIGMILLAFYHPLLLAFDTLLIIGIAVILFGLGHRAVTTSLQESKAKYAVAGWLEELARHPMAFKTAAGARFALQRSETLVRSYLSARDKHYVVFRRQLVGSLGLQVIASAVLLGLGGWLVIDRQLTLGQLVAAELVVTKVVEGFAKLSKYLETLYDLLAAVDKLGSLVDLPLDRFGGATLDLRTALRADLRQVSVEDSAAGANLRQVDLSLDAGSRIALTVTTGSSLRPLIDVISGLRLPTAGTVELDGRDTRELDPGAVSQAVTVVREVEIFKGSIAENISLGRPDIDSAAIRQALSAVGLLNHVLELPDGLQTVLKTGGHPLSSDQALRIMIARALVTRPRLLILDETLDVLDVAARETLLPILAHPDRSWTLLIVTQREDVMAVCDSVVALEGGSVIYKRYPGGEVGP